MGCYYYHVLPLLVYFLHSTTQRENSMTSMYKYLLPLLIIFFCIWNSLDIVTAWFQAPYEQLGWLILLIWLSPLIYFWAIKSCSPNEWLLGIGLIVSLVGLIG